MYRKWRNYASRLIFKAKKNYLQTKIKQNVNDSREIWKVLKEAFPVNSSIKSLPAQISVDGKLIDDPDKITNAFNKHFSTIGMKLHESYNIEQAITNNFSEINKFIKKTPNGLKEFTIPNITQKEIECQLKKLNIWKATGLDGISARILKLAGNGIFQPLTRLFNCSITNGIYPTKFKFAKVIPVFKEGDKRDCNNYRPISICSVLAKLLEKHCATAFHDHLSKAGLFHDRQSAYKNKHSCETAMINLTDQWLKTMDKGLISGVVLIDLKKAFDLVHHQTLIYKIKLYGASDHSVKWFESFLHEREQRTIYNGVLSDTEHIPIGIPQGSIMGPLLFSLFINDFPLYVTHSDSDLYADDTTITASGSNLQEIQATLRTDLKGVERWAAENKMIINVDKTKSMIIASKAKITALRKSNNFELSLNLGGNEIEQIHATKLLGLIINESLTWQHHIEYIGKKLNSRISLLLKIRNYLDKNHRLLLYNSFIYSLINYCSSVYSNCSVGLLNELLLKQKKCGRIILNRFLHQSSVKIFNELKWLPVDKDFIYRKLIMLYKTLKGDTPDYLKNKFYFNNRPSRNNVLILPRARTEQMRRTFEFSSANIWNGLPAHIKKAESLNSFKKLLKDHFLIEQANLNHFLLKKTY